MTQFREGDKIRVAGARYIRWIHQAVHQAVYPELAAQINWDTLYAVVFFEPLGYIPMVFVIPEVPNSGVGRVVLQFPARWFELVEPVPKQVTGSRRLTVLNQST